MNVDDDVVIVAALRTPLQRSRRGLFRDTQPEELLSSVLKGILERTKIPAAMVQDICVGTVLSPGGGATVSRMAAFHAGFPETTCLSTVNRQCSSGLQAVINIYNAIIARQIDVGIGAGMESMTHYYGPMSMPSNISEEVLGNKKAKECLTPMGITSENVATKYNISRKEQDLFALKSHKKAIEAQSKGFFKAEIVPVLVRITDADGKSRSVSVSTDDGPRADASMEGLAKLKPAFILDTGTTTAGNSSQVTDGASAVLLMRRSKATALGVPVLGRIVAYSVVGVSPAIMGIGPAVAIPDVLKKVGTGLGVKDIDIFEVNEAFASQATYCQKLLKIPDHKLNPKGGAIALGHPLGATGARMIATLMPELKRTNGRLGVVSMCVGTGMGAAAVIESEQPGKSSL